jgi:transcriptional regulator with XRE-family HTH domain
MKRDKLLKSKGYNLTKIQNELFRQLNEYIKVKGIKRTQFAKELGVSKGYVSQILNGEFDFKLSKLIELSLAIGKIPEITFKSIEEIKQKEKKEEISINERVYFIRRENAEYKFHASPTGVYEAKSFGIEIKNDSNYINSLMN